MRDRGERLRAELASLDRRGRGRPYPADLHARVMRFLAARRREGASLRAVADEIGMSWRTLARWQTSPPPDADALFRPVAIVEAPPAAAVVVHAPHGVRVEGLDVAALADLLRRLA